jgi:hypothetical protein
VIGQPSPGHTTVVVKQRQMPKPSNIWAEETATVGKVLTVICGIAEQNYWL